MARKVRTALIAVAASILLLNSICNHLFRHPPSITAQDLLAPPLPLSLQTNPNLAISEHQQLEQDQEEEEVSYKNSRHVTSVRESIPTVSILLPAWEILVILSPETPWLQSDGDVACLFPNNDSSTAVPAGFLSSPYRQTFKCDFPMRLRRRFPFPQPILTSYSPEEKTPAEIKSPAPELLRWNFLVYDSITTDTDVVLFVKGLNHRQGSSRSPTDFACVFGDDVINGFKTAVTSAVQEVFRCQIPTLTAVLPPSKIKISLEVLEQNRVVPSVAHYTPPPRKIATNQPKSLICACTMVYNVAKFLKEWVIYHSAIGVERFILYDNASDDDLDRVVEELIQSGYNVTTAFWIWPKTQEAGFSHCAIRAKDSCEWVTYIDVDEFIYSQSWLRASSSATIKHCFGQIVEPNPPKTSKNQPLYFPSTNCFCYSTVTSQQVTVHGLNFFLLVFSSGCVRRWDLGQRRERGEGTRENTWRYFVGGEIDLTHGVVHSDLFNRKGV